MSRYSEVTAGIEARAGTFQRCFIIPIAAFLQAIVDEENNQREVHGKSSGCNRHLGGAHVTDDSGLRYPMQARW